MFLLFFPLRYVVPGYVEDEAWAVFKKYSAVTAVACLLLCWDFPQNTFDFMNVLIGSKAHKHANLHTHYLLPNHKYTQNSNDLLIIRPNTANYQ